MSSLAVLPAAEADSGTTLYVNNATAAACSDSTTDSSTTPYCTIQAAADVVTAGQTIIVAPEPTHRSRFRHRAPRRIRSR